MKNEVNTKLYAEMQKDAQEYSFNIDSNLFHKLNTEGQKMWKEEVERHFINGMTHVLNNPSGGALLYVNKKSYDIGYKEGYEKAQAEFKEAIKAYITPTTAK